MMSPQESKLQYFEKWSQKQTSLTFLKSHQIIDFDQLWALFTQFGDNDITKEVNIPEFWKINSRTGFYLLKMQMAGSVEVFIVVGHNKLPWNCFEKLWKMTS